jgi:hypothetical protein
VMSVKMAVLWDIALCSLLDIAQHFSGAYCHHYQVYSDTLVSVCQNTLCYIPEDSHLQIKSALQTLPHSLPVGMQFRVIRHFRMIRKLPYRLTTSVAH